MVVSYNTPSPVSDRLVFIVNLLFASALLEPGTAHFFCPSLSRHFSTVLLLPSGLLMLHYICLGVGPFSVIPTRGPLHSNLLYPRTTPIFQNYTHILELPHIPELSPYSRTAPVFQAAPTPPSLYLLKFMKSWILFID